MKTLLFFLLTITSSAQVIIDDGPFIWKNPIGGWERIITDSVYWKITGYDTSKTTPCTVEHSWVCGPEVDPRPNFQCDVMHYGETCDYHWPVRDCICSHCGLIKHEKQIRIEHRWEPPKSQFELLKEKFYPPKKPEPFPSDTAILDWQLRKVISDSNGVRDSIKRAILPLTHPAKSIIP